MRVKIIKKEDPSALEDRVNEYLADAERRGTQVRDIRFSVSKGHNGYSANYWCAMIIME